MPPHLLLVPLLLGALLLLALLVLRRRADAVPVVDLAVGAVPALEGHDPEDEPLRHQAEALDEALREANAARERVAGPEGGDRVTTEVAAASAPPVDHTAHAYADLSRELARAGRLHEAALAQWAADLRVLGPLLAGRGDELCESLTRLAPIDTPAALTGARAVACALVGPSVAVTAMLPDASHLSVGTAAGDRPTYAAPDVSADLLPDAVLRALETVLVGSADIGLDRDAVSVGLRCDLVALVVQGHQQHEVAAIVRDVLEPHERPRFDAALAAASNAP